MSKIVITGASGQYGRAATDKLIALGLAEKLILITRTPEKLSERISQGCEVRYGDFDKPETLSFAVNGAEKMLLISGTRVGERVIQHKAAIDAAVKSGVKHVFYTSFIGIDDPSNPAEVRHDHIQTEHLIRESGMAWTMLRDAHYADAIIINLAPMLVQTGEWTNNWGSGREAMVWRDDCVESAVAVLTGAGHEGKIYNITGPDLQTAEEIVALISKATGKTIQWNNTDDEGQYAIFDSMGIPRKPVDDQYVKGIPWNSSDMVTFGQAIREGYLNICSNDVEKLTGKPSRSVKQMIEENLDSLLAKSTFDKS